MPMSVLCLFGDDEGLSLLPVAGGPLERMLALRAKAEAWQPALRGNLLLGEVTDEDIPGYLADRVTWEPYLEGPGGCDPNFKFDLGA
jgi:hypothetical protein